MSSSARQARDKRVPAGCCVQGSPAWQGLSRDSGAARLHESKRENGHGTVIRWWIQRQDRSISRGGGNVRSISRLNDSLLVTSYTMIAPAAPRK